MSNWMFELRRFFPTEKFRSDVNQRGPVSVLAGRAGIGKAEPYAWLAGRAPRAEGLAKFLTANEIPDNDYRDYLARAASKIRAVCSSRASTKCHREWTMTRRQLGALNQRREQRGLVPLTPDDGVISTPCAPCARAETGLRALARENDERFEGFRPNERPEVVEESMGGHQVMERNWKNFRTMIRKPKAASHRAQIALGHVAAALVKGFMLCHLCELAVVERHSGKGPCNRPHFHRVCLFAFRRWFSRTNGRQASANELPGPPRLGKRGPKPELRLHRNYRILMAWARKGRSALRA